MKNEEILATMEIQIESNKNELIPEIQNEYKEFIEWVFFFWSYDIYPINEDKLSTANNNPIESVISSAHNIININVIRVTLN